MSTADLFTARQALTEALAKAAFTGDCYTTRMELGGVAREHLPALLARLEALEMRASTLEDAAFHFQTCVTCARDGEDACESGRIFAAFLRGEEAWKE